MSPRRGATAFATAAATSLPTVVATDEMDGNGSRGGKDAAGSGDGDVSP